MDKLRRLSERLQKRLKWKHQPILRGRSEALDRASLRLKRILEDVAQQTEVDTIRGREGDAARTYFEVFDHLILAGR
jgi:CRISPR-associated protein Cas1